ncbi:MAG: NAD-dependent epimerase/dehydratase family protein [Acidimicrobiales bacterium]
MDEIILIIGAQGSIGSMLRHSLRRAGRHLRLLDIAPLSPLEPDEDAELISGSFLDAEIMANACRGARAIVHLGGLSHRGFSWPEYLEVNIHGTYVLADAAYRADVERIVYASSNHAAGFVPLRDDGVIPDYEFPRPDTYYGVSKAASEGLLSLYHDRHGLGAICLRIGSYRDRPFDLRSLSTWLSPGDCTRLVEAALATPTPGFRVVWGVSANSRAAVSLDEGRAIGYEPIDNAEDYASEIAGVQPKWKLLGGPYTEPDPG